MNDFDKQLADFFYGADKAITPNAIKFMNTFNRIAKDTRFRCVTTWQDDNMIFASIQEFEGDSTITGVQGCDLNSDFENSAWQMIAHIENPPLTMQPGRKREDTES